MDTRFEGRTVLVAGGTGALGRAVSLAFLQEGATVAVTYRQADEYDALVSAVGPSRDRLQGHMVDVTDEHGAGDLVGTIVRRSGRLDVLVNAVGGYAGGATLWETDAGTLVVG